MNKDGRNEEMLERHARHLHGVAGLSEATVKTYSWHVRAFTEYLEANHDVDLENVDAAVIEGYLEALASDGWMGSSRRVARSALRSFYERYLGLDEENNPACQARAPKRQPPQKDAYTDAQAARILKCAAVVPGVSGRFDHAVLATLRYTGLRLGELVSIKRSDLDREGRRLEVIGKGSRQRYVPIPHPLEHVLAAYFDQIRPQCPSSIYVFASPRSMSHSPWWGKTNPQSVSFLTNKYGERSDVPGPHNPHKWRHTYATSLLRSGVDLHRVQRLLGHSSVQTTVSYLHLVDDDLREAVDGTFGSDPDARW